MSNYAGFSSVQLNRPKRSSFDLTHSFRLSMTMGKLTPVLIQECIPSDLFRGSTEMLVRLAPLLSPLYDQINCYVHFFFVPNRLLWSDWEEFITGGRLGVGVDPVSAPVPPFFDIEVIMAGQPSLFDNGQLMDYLGIPGVHMQNVGPDPADWNGLTLDAMPMLAYQRVWYDFYRDRNFVADDVMEFPYASGDLGAIGDIEPLLGIQTRNIMHDYFHSALPFTQRGEEVLMPISLGGVAPLYVDPLAAEVSASMDATAQPGAIAVGYTVTVEANAGTDPGDLYVKGEDFDGTSTSINDFRSAYALQVWLERNAIGGSRYTESTQAHFGVKPQDFRLQRAEYVGGGVINVRISEVLNTSWSGSGAAAVQPLGSMAGHGIAYGNTNRFNYFCSEHGFIIGIASIMNPPSYQQGLPRMFRRRSFLDYPWPTFAKLGEQEVHDFELYVTPLTLTEDADGNVPLFGYQSRYADWKYVCSRNAGLFRDDLLFWTLTSVYQDVPVLSKEFNEFDPTVAEAVFAVTNTGDQFWVYCHNSVFVKRPLPYFGTPNTLGFGS